MPTLYQTLGVEPKADDTSLRKAYRRLARKHHPDVNTNPESHERMTMINEAFRVLIDPGRRMEYDAMLAGGMPTVAPTKKTPKNPVQVRLLVRLKGHRTPVYALGFAPDSGRLVSSAFDNEVLWWDIEAEAVIRRLRLETGAVSTLRAIAEQRVVAAGGGDQQITASDIRGERTETARSSANWPACAAISTNGRLLATGSVHRSLLITETATGKTVSDWRDHGGSVTAVAWSGDGRFLASGSSDSTVRVRDSKSGAMLHTVTAIRTTVTALAFSPDSRYLSVAAVDLSIRVFDLSNGQLVKVMFGHEKPIEALDFHPNGWLFASGARDGKVGLWNASEGMGQVLLDAGPRPVLCVSFDRNGARLAAGSQDKTVRVWSVEAKKGP